MTAPINTRGPPTPTLLSYTNSQTFTFVSFNPLIFRDKSRCRPVACTRVHAFIISDHIDHEQPSVLVSVTLVPAQIFAHWRTGSRRARRSVQALDFIRFYHSGLYLGTIPFTASSRNLSPFNRPRLPRHRLVPIRDNFYGASCPFPHRHKWLKGRF